MLIAQTDSIPPQPILNIHVDYTFLEGLFGHSNPPLREMLNLFLEVVEPEQQLLQKYKEQGDWKSYSASVHKIKSNLRFIGFSDILQTAEWLEKHTKANTPTSKTLRVINDFAEAIRTALEVVKNELSHRPHAGNQ